MATRHFWVLQRKHRQLLYLTTSYGLLLVAAAVAIGPKHSQSSVVLREWPGGVWTWVGVWVVAGFTKLALYYVWHWGEALRYGSAFGGAVALTWTLSLVAAGGELRDWTLIPAWLMIAIIQFLGAMAVHGRQE